MFKYFHATTPAYYIHFHKASIPVYDNLNGRRVKENILRERNREISARTILTYMCIPYCTAITKICEIVEKRRERVNNVHT